MVSLARGILLGSLLDDVKCLKFGVLDVESANFTNFGILFSQNEVEIRKLQSRPPHFDEYFC